MKKKIWIAVVFILSAASLIISLNIFYNLAIYTDEYNTSPSVVLGGELWLNMSWIRLLLLFILTFVTGVKLLEKK